MPSEEGRVDAPSLPMVVKGVRHAGDVVTFLRKKRRDIQRMADESRKTGTFLGATRSINVPCGKCNACCFKPWNVFLVPGEEQIYEHVYNDNGIPQLASKPDGSCVYLESGKCSIYDTRPGSCRLYDCRTYTLIPESVTVPEISKVVKSWRFSVSLRDAAAAFAFRQVIFELSQVLKTCNVDGFVVIALEMWEKLFPDWIKHLLAHSPKEFPKRMRFGERDIALLQDRLDETERFVFPKQR